MARCDEGYVCEVCGRPVVGVADSDLYLRYVLGEASAAELPGAAERHLRCNPALSQFIDDDRFDAPAVAGPFGRASLDAAFVAAEVARVTTGYRRLREAVRLRLPIEDYPAG